MSVAIKWEITLNGILITVSVVVGLIVQGITWAWHEAGQNALIREQQIAIQGLQRADEKHDAKDAHLGMERRASGIEARQSVMETNLTTTNRILAEIRQDVRSLVRARRGVDFEGSP